MIDLRCQDVAMMLASLPDGCADFTHFDPPWTYSGGQEAGHTGLAGHHYKGLPVAAIAAHLAAAYRVAALDSYCAFWATFPLLAEWMATADQWGGWEYISGGAWGKTNGLGVGYHFRGDAELLLLYRKGNPKPLGGSKSNLWLAERTGTHSEKPQTALRTLVQMGAPVGGLVVDCYAGSSASLALACRDLNRNYIGAELSASRHATALTRLSQQKMAWEAVS